MNILKKYNTIIKYSINLPYLIEHPSLSTNLHTTSGWRREKENSFVLIHDVFCEAKGSEDLPVIDYHSQLELCCQFGVMEEDALEIVQLKRQAMMEMKTFLEKNTKSFFGLLNLPNQLSFDSLPTKDDLEREIRSIERIMESPSFEKMTEEQKKIAKLSIPFSIVVKTG